MNKATNRPWQQINATIYEAQPQGDAQNNAEYWLKRQHEPRVSLDGDDWCLCGLPVAHKVHVATPSPTTEAVGEPHFDNRRVDPRTIPEKWLSDVKFFDHIQGTSDVCTWQCGVCFQKWDSTAKLPCPRCRPNWKDELEHRSPEPRIEAGEVPESAAEIVAKMMDTQIAKWRTQGFGQSVELFRVDSLRGEITTALHSKFIPASRIEAIREALERLPRYYFENDEIVIRKDGPWLRQADVMEALRQVIAASPKEKS